MLSLCACLRCKVEQLAAGLCHRHCLTCARGLWAGHATHAGGGAGGFEEMDLPEGINVEEARMLEAAMLGIPYQGRIPDFRNMCASENRDVMVLSRAHAHAVTVEVLGAIL